MKASDIILKTIKSLLGATAVALIGCVVIALAVPFVKMAVVNHAIDTAQGELAGGDAAAARESIERHELWALRYPSLAGRLAAEMVRCYCRMGKLNLADGEAGRIHNRLVEWPAVQTAGDLITEGPDWLANKIIGMVKGAPDPLWDPHAGYMVILLELHADQEYEQLEAYAASLLEKDSSHTFAGEITAPEPEPLGDTRTNQVPSKTGYTAGGPAQAPADNAGKKAEELRAREKELNAKTEARLAELTKFQPPPSENEKNCRAARTRHKQLVARSASMQQQLEKSSGAARVKILEDLRRMKSDVAMSQNSVSRLETAVRQEEGARQARLQKDPELVRLRQELEQVQTGLQNP